MRGDEVEMLIEDNFGRESDRKIKICMKGQILLDVHQESNIK